MGVAVLLSGCGVYDGSEIQESVFTFLALSQNNLDFFCVAPDIKQHHVVNHSSGVEMKESRSVLFESSRISRGKIIPLSELDVNSISSLVIPGGFGAAKNLSDWAFKGDEFDVLEDVRSLILNCVKQKKPIVSLCISPVLIAKSLEGSSFCPKLTVGSVNEKSDYNISEINSSLSSLGSHMKNVSKENICYDEDLKIISAPCYMLDLTVDEVYNNIKSAIDKLKELV